MVSEEKYAEFIKLNNKVMKQMEEYLEILENSETDEIVRSNISSPLMIICHTAIGGSLISWRNLMDDTKGYLSALLNEDDEYINSFIKDVSLLSNQLNTFIGNYNSISKS